MSAPLTLAALSADVRALLVERYEQWQSSVPWYRKAAAPVEEVPLYVSLERLIREQATELAALRADLRAEDDGVENLRADLARERHERETERRDARAELDRERTERRACFDRKNELSHETIALRAELAAAYAQRDRQREKADTASRLYLEKQSEWARFLFRIMRCSAESGVKLPTDDEEAAGRTLDVFVREIARGYRRARLMLALLEGERETWRSEALLYREGVVWNVDCLGCAGLLTKLRAAEEANERTGAELAAPLGGDDGVIASIEQMHREDANPQACLVPPEGWVCSRPRGHGGPCAASPFDEGGRP